jgi:transposase
MKEKRKTRLTIREKYDIIQDMRQSNMSQRNAATKYNLSVGAVNALFSKREEILNYFDKGSPLSSDLRSRVRYQELDEAVLKWFVETRDAKIPVNGVKLKSVAKEIAMEKGVDNFKASNGWLESFIHRHQLKYRNVSHENEIVMSLDRVDVPQLVMDSVSAPWHPLAASLAS